MNVVPVQALDRPSPVAATKSLRLSSVLPPSYQADLEQLMFFNPGQHRAIAGIEESVARHGLPEIIAAEDTLHIHVGALGRVQAVFALLPVVGEEELAGAIAYFRPSVEELLILHMAVCERCASTGTQSHTFVLLRLFQSVRDSARRLRGVRWIVMYLPAGPVRLPVS